MALLATELQLREFNITHTEGGHAFLTWLS